VFKADYRGFVGLPKDVEAFTSATYYFSGQSQQVSQKERPTAARHSS